MQASETPIVLHSRQAGTCAVSALLSAPCFAEGIALGNPLSNADFGLLWGLPLLGCLALTIFLAVTSRRALVQGLIACALFIGGLLLVSLGGMSNGMAVLWLIALVLSPWICFLLLTACAAFALWKKRGGAEEESEDLEAAESRA